MQIKPREIFPLYCLFSGVKLGLSFAMLSFIVLFPAVAMQQDDFQAKQASMAIKKTDKAMPVRLILP